MEEVEEVPDEVELFAEVGLAHGGAAQRQDLRQQLEAIRVGPQAAVGGGKFRNLNFFNKTHNYTRVNCYLFQCHQ